MDRRTAGGEVVPGFADTLGTPFDDPVAVAVSAGPEGATVCVLDRARSSLHLLGTDGGYHREIALTAAGTLSGLAVTARAVYVGEAGSGVVAFRWTGERVGVAAGMPGPVGALALDGRGGLVVHPGGAAAPVRLLLDAAFVRHGVAWGGPFGGFSLTAKCWQRLVATWRSTGPGAHATVYVHTTDDPVRPPAVDPGSPDPYADRDWSPGPPDLDEFLVRRPPARYAWVGVHLTGDGTATTELEQIRLELDRPGYAEDLPAIYREDGPDAFLPRFLALAQGLFGEVEDATTGLTRLLDAAAAPEPFLDALARWLAVDPPVGRDVPGLRDAVAGAYREYGARGTVAGLRQAVRRGVGVDVLIEEPILAAGWWALVDDEGATDAERECSVLGVSTMLSAAEPQGAVLGTTATLDRSHLIEGTEYGMPAFDAVAHRFTARLYRGATYSAQRRAAVTALLERERPAHVEFNVCCVEPGLAVGTARVGIDAVLCGGATPDGRAGAVRIGDDAVLGGEPPGRIGERSAVGVTTRLGSGAVTDR